MRWMDFTSQPLDAIYAYFGAKVSNFSLLIIFINKKLT
jgi:hypothetical protein